MSERDHLHLNPDSPYYALRQREVGRCGSCCWWDPPISRFDVAGICVLMSEDAPGWPTQPDKAGAWCEKSFAEFHTTPDFGCVLWEPHDTEGTA